MQTATQPIINVAIIGVSGFTGIEALRIDRAVVGRDRHRAARRKIERAAQLQRAAVECQRTRRCPQSTICSCGQRALRDRGTAGVGVAARHRQRSRPSLLDRARPADGARVVAGAVLLETHQPVIGHGQRQVRRVRLQRRATADGGNDRTRGRAERARQVERAALHQRS